MGLPRVCLSGELQEVCKIGLAIENGAFCSFNLQPVEFLVMGKLEDELVDYSVDSQCAAYKL